MKNEVLIFGHKNPDTDTICSSMVKEMRFYPRQLLRPDLTSQTSIQ